MTLLADALVPQGVTVVERGLDHYFAAPDIDRRIAAMAQAVLETLAESARVALAATRRATRAASAQQHASTIGE